MDGMRNDIASSDREYFVRENRKLREENERLVLRVDDLQGRVDEQQAELDRLEAIVARTDDAKEKQEALDAFLGKGKGSSSKKGKAKEKQEVRSSTAERSSEVEAPPQAAPPIDTRKVIDEFKKPLDDTKALIQDFAMKREVPTLLQVAQAEAMRDDLNKKVASASRARAKMDEAKRETPNPR